MQQSGGCCGCNNTLTKELELSDEQLAWIEGQKKKQGSSSDNNGHHTFDRATSSQHMYVN